MLLPHVSILLLKSIAGIIILSASAVTNRALDLYLVQYQLP